MQHETYRWYAKRMGGIAFAIEDIEGSGMVARASEIGRMNLANRSKTS